MNNDDADVCCSCDVEYSASDLSCPVCISSQYKASNSITMAKIKGPHIVDMMLHYQKLAKEKNTKSKGDQS